MYGKVYLARHKSNYFIVALKKINLRKLCNSSTIKLIRRELEIHSRLVHENIIQMYGYFWDMKNLYYILEYASGNSLFS